MLYAVPGEVAMLLHFREACGPASFAYTRDWRACNSVAALIFPLLELTPLGTLNWLLREPCKASLRQDLCDGKESGPCLFQAPAQGREGSGQSDWAEGWHPVDCGHTHLG